MLQTLYAHVSPSHGPRSPSQGLWSRVACELWLRDGIYIHSFPVRVLDTLVSCQSLPRTERSRLLVLWEQGGSSPCSRTEVGSLESQRWHLARGMEDRCDLGRVTAPSWPPPCAHLYNDKSGLRTAKVPSKNRGLGDRLRHAQ